MIGSSRLLCSKPRTPTLAGRQKKNRPAAEGNPSQRAAIIRITCPLENARISPSMSLARVMKRSARAATSVGDSEEFPAWQFLQDVHRQLALEAAAVPLDQVRIDVGGCPETG